jgi:hypothetical protein
MINAELSFLGDFTAALTLIFISLENVVSDFLRYGDSWGFVHVLVSRKGAKEQRRKGKSYGVVSFIILRKSSRGDSGSLISGITSISGSSGQNSIDTSRLILTFPFCHPSERNLSISHGIPLNNCS